MKLLMVAPILFLVFVGDGVAEEPSTSCVTPTTESPAGMTEEINTSYMTPTSVSRGMTAATNTSYVTPTCDSHAVNPSTCNWCLGSGNVQECEVLNLQTQKPCSLDQFPNIGTTHCYTAAGTFKSSNAPEIIFTGFARGCINCTDKAAACAAFVEGFIAQPQNWTSLNCTIECCTADNCNNQFVTAVPPNPVTPTSESHGAVNETACIECFEVEALNISCKNSIRLIPCSSQCYTAKGNIKYFSYSPDEVITTVLEGRGCVNCTDKEAFCAEFNTTLPFQNMTLIDCNYIECCSGDNCNNHNLTVIPTKATATPAPFPTTTVNQTTCISCVEFGPNNISCISHYSLVPCRFHCYSLKGISEYYSVDQVNTAPLEIRGCSINCPDQEAVCLDQNATFALSNITLLACNVDCCDGNLCNNQSLTGLDRSETSSTPTIPSPRVPSLEEEKEAVKVSIPLITDQYEWNFQTDKTFKEKISSVTTSFCTQSRIKCALKEARRKRRSLFDLYTADQVHLLPGYPRNASGSLQVAFYVQQPRGLFIGNASILPGETLVNIVKTYKSEIETAIGANISRVEAFIQSLLTPTTLPKKVPDSNDTNKGIFIGVGITGGVVLICSILLVIFWLKTRRRGNITISFRYSRRTETVDSTDLGSPNLSFQNGP